MFKNTQVFHPLHSMIYTENLGLHDCWVFVDRVTIIDLKLKPTINCRVVVYKNEISQTLI